MTKMNLEDIKDTIQHSIERKRYAFVNHVNWVHPLRIVGARVNNGVEQLQTLSGWIDHDPSYSVYCK